MKKGYKLPRPMMTITDLGRLFKSEEIRGALRRAPKKSIIISKKNKPNPLKKIHLLGRLNPYALVEKRKTILAQQEQKSQRAEIQKKAALEKVAALKKVYKLMNETEKKKLKRLQSPFPKNRGAKSKKGGKKAAATKK